MGERDSRNQKELEEFVLVKNDKTPIFRETDVKVRPIAIGKNGPEFEVVDKEDKRIGIVKDDKTFEFDKEYKEELKEKMGSYYDLLNFENEVLKYDVIKELQKQDEKEKKDEHQKERNNSNLQKKTEEQEKDNNKLEKNENKKSLPITKEELGEKIGKEIYAFTIINEDDVLDDMHLTGNVDKNCVLIAEVEGEDEFQVLYRENGTGEIKDIKPKEYQDSSIEEVTRLKNNKETKESMGTRIKINEDNDLEFSVKKEYGQIKINRVMRKENGEKILSEIITDIGYPTEQEYNRMQDERLNKNGKISGNSLLTEEEVKTKINEIGERIGKINNKKVKEMVLDRVEGIQENLTMEELEEIIDECDDEYSIANGVPVRDAKRVEY